MKEVSMVSAPAASVVIPCHNAARWLPETLSGILSQSFPDLEIVLVDDGSTDSPADVVAAIADPRIRLFALPASGTPSRPRNVGIRNSRGAIVFFCDADDVMMPGKIERQMAVFAEAPDVGLTFTDFQVIDPSGKVLVPSFLAGYDAFRKLVRGHEAGINGYERDRMVSALLHANFIGTSSVAVRRTVLDDAGGFDETLASSEDYDLWLRIARRHSCAFVDMIGHGYRRHPASLMQEPSIRHPLARINVLKRQLDISGNAADRRALHRRVATNYCSVGYSLECAADFAGARRNYLAALRHWPLSAAVWGLFKLTVPFFMRRHRRTVGK